MLLELGLGVETEAARRLARPVRIAAPEVFDELTDAVRNEAAASGRSAAASVVRVAFTSVTT